MAWKDKETMRAYFKNRYDANVEFIARYKIEQGCADCGCNEHHAMLEFDHIMPRLRGTVASQMGKSLKVIMEEVARCEVVCGNCHNMRTWRRNQERIHMCVH